MILCLGFIVFVLCWKWTESIDVEDDTTKPNWVVERSVKCEPEDWRLKTVHKVLPSWKPFQQMTRKPEDLVKKLTLQGHSLAGRTEFPWLVELREKPTEDFRHNLNWANGNLITGTYVLTTCEAVADFVETTGKKNAFNEKLGVKNWYLIKKNPEKYKVLYGSRYTYETNAFYNKFEVGTREVGSFIPHPKCNYFVLDYSIGVVRLRDQSIWPFPPFTSYMHVDVDCDAFQKLKTYYNSPARKTDEESDYCSIALWSRKIFGDDPITSTKDPVKRRQYERIWNHKVKYAVKWVDPKYCKSVEKAFPHRMRGQDIEFFECMALNDTETVGVICNHDQGAPIVCKGVVRAILLAGAIEENCTNVSPLPFLVVDARFMYSLWTNINSIALKNLSLQNVDVNPKPRSGAVRWFSTVNAVFLLMMSVLYFH